MMKKVKGRKIDIEKASTLSIVLNSVEIVVLIVLLLSDFNNVPMWRPLMAVAVVVLMIEACLSIRDAYIWRDTHRQNEMLKDASAQLNELNTRLRMNRHDFMNHLQVVYSLVDMNENQEAIHYIEQVYGQMKRISNVMKTSKPSINALLHAKQGVAQEKNIKISISVTSDWKNLPMNDWEMCRVLGNIIDNATDALGGQDDPQLGIELYEDLRAYYFKITNNGPMVPLKEQERIFYLGFTTKTTGQGLGLHICKELMQNYGGDIELQSTAAETSFIGHLPRTTAE